VLSTDALGATDTDTVAITVTVVSDPPVFTSQYVSGNMVSLKGTAEPLAKIKVFVESTTVASAQANAQGAWDVSFFREIGTYPVQATATDGLGNVSVLSAVLRVTVSENSRQPASLTFSALVQEYDGQPKPVSVSVVPAGLKVVVYYGSTTVAPTAVGSYAVFAIVDSTSFQGSSSGTLVIKPGKQTISFPEPAGVAAGSRTALVATASSGLPVSFTVVSGPARIEGGSLVALGRGTVVVRASQPGNGSYAPAPDVERSVSVGLAAQTISFEVASAGAVGSSLPLKATASSGLPVVFEVISGPARIESGLLVLTAAGDVVVRASQPGDANYAAAGPVDRRLQVGAGAPQTFLAEVIDPNQSVRRGRVAAFLPGDGRFLTLILLAPEIGLQGAFNVQVAPDGSFSLQVATAGTSGSAEPGPARAASTPGQVTLRGSVRDGQLAIDFSELGLRAAAGALPAAGPGTAVTGAYRADFIGTLQGNVQAIALPSGQAAVLLQGTDGVFGGILDLGTGFSFSGALAGTSGTTQVSGALAADKGALTGTFKLPNAVQADFSGLATALPSTGRLINLSSLARSGGGEATLIAGFTVEGSAQRAFLVRGAGPSLAGFGVSGFAPNPRIRLYQGASLLAENDDWHTGTAGAGNIAAVSSRVGAFPLADGSADAALLSTVSAGSYTVHVEAGGADGVALAEIYDAGAGAVAALSNLAVRSTLDAVGGALTVGFVIDGNAPRRLLVRAIGPGLAQFGVAGVVSDPRLIVRRETTVVAENDNWNADETSGIAVAARSIGAFGLPAGSKDAVLLLTLAPGAYTAQMTSSSGGGVGLVEVYQLP
jgi:hypothetical protein